MKAAKLNITPKVIHDAAYKAGIKWDNDTIFMLISETLTGKMHLDDMSEGELEAVLLEIEQNPAPFTKEAHFVPGKFKLKSKNEKGEPEHSFFRDNHDYTGESYLDKVERKLKRLSKTLKKKKHTQEAKELDSMIKSVRPKKKKK